MQRGGQGQNVLRSAKDRQILKGSPRVTLRMRLLKGWLGLAALILAECGSTLMIEPGPFDIESAGNAAGALG